MRGRSDERGIVLVIVLVFALLLASMVATFGRRAVIDHMTANNREAMARAESIARGGVRLAQALLLEDRLREQQPGAYPGEALSDLWALVGMVPIELEDGSTLRLRIEDVGSKLNLNAVLRFGEDGAANERTRPLLDALLAKVIDEIPLPPASKLYEREQLVANLIDYVDPDEVSLAGGSENEAFERGQTTVRPANRPLLTVDELRLVEGFDATLVEALRPYVTVYPYVGTEGVNPNTAPPHVLSLLFFDDGVDLRLAPEDTVRELLEVRQEGMQVCGESQSGETCRPIREIVENAIFPPPSFASDVFVVTADVHVGSVRRRIEAVLDRGTGAQPLLLSWRVL
jgi:general secretion pathway protein K